MKHCGFAPRLFAGAHSDTATGVLVCVFNPFVARKCVPTSVSGIG